MLNIHIIVNFVKEYLTKMFYEKWQYESIENGARTMYIRVDINPGGNGIEFKVLTPIACMDEIGKYTCL